MIEAIGRLVRGLGFTSAQVGAARGLLEAAVFGGIAAFGVAFTALDLTVLGLPSYITPIVVGGVMFGKRWIEGLADGIDPANVRKPPRQ